MRKIFQIHPSQHCNYSCSHCYSSSSPNQKIFLTKVEIEQAISDAAAMGYGVLSISGGEPMMYPYLKEILETAKNEGMSTSLVTNGSFRAESYKKIAGLLDTIAVSLDGNEETHDSVRGRKGAFRKVDAFLDFMQGYVLKTGVVYSLSNASWQQLSDVLKYASTKEIDLFQIHPIEPIGRAINNSELLLSRENLKRSYLFIQLISTHFPFTIHLDALNKSDAIKELIPNPEGSEPSEKIDLLVMDELGNILPYSYGISRDWAITNIKSQALKHAWVKFERKLDSFKQMCEATINAMEEQVLLPSYLYSGACSQ